MLESLEKMPTMPQMTNVVNKQDGSGKPLTKTTSKTEVNMIREQLLFV
jgi:hypothetical protein